MEIISYVELLAKKIGHYSLYAFKNLENNTFIMCTVLPRWDMPDMQIGEKGFLKYQIVKAGEPYYNPNTDTFIKYKYTNQYFMSFIKEGDKQTNQEQIIV